MTLEVTWTTRFKRDYKLAMRRGRDIGRLDEAIRAIAAGEPLPEAMHDHALSGRWSDSRECHVEPDWLLIYRVDEGLLILELVRTGSHADLFGL